jgi:hypothetical protein
VTSAKGGRVPPTGFARSDRGLEYALVQDATGKSVGEIIDMADADRYATAMIRARFYRERAPDSGRR